MSSERKRAIIVIDVQEEYFSGNLKIQYPDPILSLNNIHKIIDFSTEQGIPVVIVKNILSPESPLFSVSGKYTNLVNSIEERKRDLYIEKQLPSVFSNEDFDHWLKSNGIDTLVITGYMTHNCDDSTVKHAFHLGYHVELISDATGSVPYSNEAGEATAEEIHRVLCVVNQARFAAVLSTDQWLECVKDQRLPVRSSIHASHQQAIC